MRRCKGVKHGLARRSKAYGQRLRRLGHAAVRRAAIERAEAYRVHIEWALRQPGLFGAVRPISFGAAANRLNERNIESPKGSRWRGDLLQRMAPRLGIHHPPGYVRRDVVRERVRALWKTHPEYTVKQVIASLGFERPVVFSRVEKMWRACREPFARHHRAQRQMGWPLDCRTTTRLRIAAIWRQHPEFTAKTGDCETRARALPEGQVGSGHFETVLACFGPAKSGSSRSNAYGKAQRWHLLADAERQIARDGFGVDVGAERSIPNRE